MYQELEKLPVEIIQDFRRTGESKALRPALQQYILQLDRCSELYNEIGNINRAAKKLQEHFPDITFQTARARMYDAINYFHLNNTVKEEAWNNFYADKLEDIGRQALADDNITEARRCFERAREYRIQASRQTIDPESLKPVEVLINPDTPPERFGLTDKDMRVLWNDTESFIEKLPVDSRSKSRFKNEARLALGKYAEDAEYDEDNNEDPEE